MALAMAPMRKISAEEICDRKVYWTQHGGEQCNPCHHSDIFNPMCWHWAFLTFSHLPSFLSHLPLHGLIEHEVHSRIEDQDERRQRAVPQHSHTLTGDYLSESIWEGHTEAGGSGWQKTRKQPPHLQTAVLPTTYASVVGLMKVFIPELCPLKLQSSVDHPHGSGEDHVHGTFGDNTWVTILIPYYRIRMDL